MRSLFTVAVFALVGSLAFARLPEFEPTEEQISDHRDAIFKIARDFIVETFNVIPIEEGQFNPVRFNSTGVWGDFHSRIKELGDDRYEVQGWLLGKGYEGQATVWSVVLTHPLEDPDAWMYRRIDDVAINEPEITSWRFGGYRSVPYEAEYSDGFLNGDS